MTRCHQRLRLPGRERDNRACPWTQQPDLPPITLLLRRATRATAQLSNQVFESLYPQLRRVARARAQPGRADSMNTTMLVHESFMGWSTRAACGSKIDGISSPMQPRRCAT